MNQESVAKMIHWHAEKKSKGVYAILNVAPSPRHVYNNSCLYISRCLFHVIVLILLLSQSIFNNRFVFRFYVLFPFLLANTAVNKNYHRNCQEGDQEVCDCILLHFDQYIFLKIGESSFIINYSRAFRKYRDN